MKRLLILLLFAFPCFASHDYSGAYRHPNISATHEALLDPPQATNTFCAANLACTVTGSWSLNNVANMTGCTVNGVIYVGGANVCAFAGSDIGAQINSAYASCGTQGCTIRLLQQSSGTACYAYSTPIVFGTNGKLVRFESDVNSVTAQPIGSCLNFTPTTNLSTTAASVTANVATLTMTSNPLTFGFVVGEGVFVSGFTGADTYFNGSFVLTAVNSTTVSFALTHANASATSNGTVGPSAITINASVGTQQTNWGIYNLQLVNNGGCNTQGGCGSGATGIMIAQAQFVELAGLQITGFGIGVNPGISGPFGYKLRDMNLTHNTNAVYVNAAYENLFFERGIYQANTTAFNFQNAGAGGLTEIKIKDISCDDNFTCVNIANQTGLNSFVLDNVHHENVLLAAPTYLTAGTGTDVMYIGGGLYDDTTTAQAQMVSSSGSTLVVYGTHLKKQSGAMTQVFNLTSPVRTWLQPVNDTQNTLGTLTGGTSANVNLLPLNGFNGGGASLWNTAESPFFMAGGTSWASIPNDPLTFTQGVKLCMNNGGYCMGNGNNTWQTEVGTWFQVGPALFANNATTTTPDTVGGIALLATPGGYAAKEGTAPTVAGPGWDECYADSTAHALKCTYNNGSFFNQTQTIGTGNVTTAGTAVNTLTCQAQTGITVTGAATTDNVIANIGAALPATWQTGIVMEAHVTATNTVTVYLCNPTATASITPAATQVNVRVVR